MDPDMGPREEASGQGHCSSDPGEARWDSVDPVAAVDPLGADSLLRMRDCREAHEGLCAESQVPQKAAQGTWPPALGSDPCGSRPGQMI
jgi:hypothetical protein